VKCGKGIENCLKFGRIFQKSFTLVICPTAFLEALAEFYSFSVCSMRDNYVWNFYFLNCLHSVENHNL